MPKEVDLEDALEELSTIALECRTLRHAWKIVASSLHRGERVEELECLRDCGVRKVMYYHAASGRFIQCKMDYSETDGYRMAGTGHVTTAVNARIRMALWNREQ